MVKICFVPTCKNDSDNSPNKLFVRIREDVRERWCQEVNAEYFKIYTMYCCEDHFDPQMDLKNYLKCKLMNEEPKFKPTARLRNIPSISYAHDNSNVPLPGSTELRKILLDYEPQHTGPAKKKIKLGTEMPSTSGSLLPIKPIKVDIATQCVVKLADKSTSYKQRKTVTVQSQFEEPSSQEISSATTQATPSLFGSTSDTDDKIIVHSRKANLSRITILENINKKPKLYLGLPKPYLWLLNYIVENNEFKIYSLCLIVALFKIKQNDSIERMSDQFELSRSKLSNMILTGIEVLATFFQNLIVCPKPNLIKQNLPLVFKIRYSDVQMIIDCFEIQISKPSNPLRQAQTWSQYKNCNTVKYLIGCTPNGFVSFISEGYGGRISDKAIVEKSNLLDVLPDNAIVLADRGFKEIESILSARGIKLLRPPSVYSGVKQTYVETQKSKVIASLRVHVERIIRRIREYALLKPHSVVHYKYVPYLDEAVIISCGLINLQGEIIKSF